MTEMESLQGCEYEFLEDHDVGSISSLSDLPDLTRNRLVGLLRHRMGEKGYSRLRFAGGEVMKPEAQTGEQQALPVAEHSESYLLYFLLPADDGSEGYCIQIPLDANGRVIGPIGVPGIATDPQKARIISKSTALAVAVEHGAPADTQWAEMLYVTPCDCLEWVVTYPNGRDRSKFKMLDLHINAHDPRKMSWSASAVYN